jgi:hypothetical protein
LTPETRLAPNVKELAAKVMDGEAIIINLANGIYYSMDQVGGLIWGLISAGRSLEEISSQICRTYDVGADRALADLEQVAKELLQENLVVIADATETAPPDAGAERPVKLPYEPPALNKYRDMADLLALDPPMPSQEDIPWDPSAGRSPGRE